MLEWLWDAIVEPVLIRLDFCTTPALDSTWPKVWWCPTGLLSFLPIHAAGYHNDPQPRSAMDCVISAYTSTVRALKYSRDNISPPEEKRGLIIAMPNTPNQDPLPGARSEAAIIRKHFRSDGHQFKLDRVMFHPSRQEVREAIEGKTFVHFACHAKSDESDPSSSALFFNDGPITVGEISQLSIRGGSLAYLSACHTALSLAPKLDDESITLTSAFQVAGFSRVVGTLWKVVDSASSTVAKDFYGNMEGDVGKAADALHAAVKSLRDEHRTEPSLWAAYTYTGA